MSASRREAIVQMDVAALRPSEPLKRLPESREPLLQFRIALREGYHHANPPPLVGLLRARRERPRGCRATEQRDEVAALHSITSSASASSLSGIWRPSALAVLRLRIVSYFVGACT